MNKETIAQIREANESINEAIGTLERELDVNLSMRSGLYDFIRNFDLFEIKLEEELNGKE